MQRYNNIGCSYINTRRSDPRIVHALVDLLALPPGSLIADIGAGTGNYTNALADCGFHIHAVEPSAVMREQAILHPSVSWHEGVAENIPLPDNSVQGIICTLALHHFSNIAQSLAEMNRVTGDGPFVFLTFDYREIEPLWLADYFPSLWKDAAQSLPPLHSIASQIKTSTARLVEIIPFLLPPDLSDLFMAAGWQHPELYLDAAVRAGISSFALGSKNEIEMGLKRLRGDVDSGYWNDQYGWVRSVHEIDAGYRFLRARI
jgi:ubiquinone/menaquinone biosynthesis C-methylase UbiE